MCSILSNHQAPSHDIAGKFGSLDRVKHVFSGGYWFDGTSWIRAGEKVRKVLHSHPKIQRHLGWVPERKLKLGLLFLNYRLSMI